MLHKVKQPFKLIMLLNYQIQLNHFMFQMLLDLFQYMIMLERLLLIPDIRMLLLDIL